MMPASRDLPSFCGQQQQTDRLITLPLVHAYGITMSHTKPCIQPPQEPGYKVNTYVYS